MSLNHLSQNWGQVQAARVYKLYPAMANTFLVTVNRTVVANITDIAPEQFHRVADATSEMLATVR